MTEMNSSMTLYQPSNTSERRYDSSNPKKISSKERNINDLNGVLREEEYGSSQLLKINNRHKIGKQLYPIKHFSLKLFLNTFLKM